MCGGMDGPVVEREYAPRSPESFGIAMPEMNNKVNETLTDMKVAPIKISGFEMKDKGKRTTFESGAKREVLQGKGRFDLVSPVMLARLAVIMERGAAKYSDRNWEKGMPLSRFVDSAYRHLTQYLFGQRDEDHVGQAIFNLMALLHTQAMIDNGKLPESLNDLPNYQGEGEAAFICQPICENS